MLPSDIANHQPYRQRHIATQNIRESMESLSFVLYELLFLMLQRYFVKRKRRDRYSTSRDRQDHKVHG